MTKRVAIFLSGGGSNMRALVEDMTGDHPARPCVVVSNVADAGGIAWAKDRGIPTEVVDHKPFAGDRAAFENELTARLMPHAPDIICLAGFMRKLTGGFTDAWAGRMINIHPSLLPRYTGLHTHARALEAGDIQHGCTVHEVTAALDDGPILGQATIPVMAGDTPEDLAARVLVQEHRLYPAVLRRFASGNRDLLMLES
ncbi:MAG TPA: phosphoribosylglycinamide formyltransferase [Sulfitobacter pontiacus]|nr:phosphoribosylglycinamide formyltransferase [Sulfitobacter pontiacus]